MFGHVAYGQAIEEPTIAHQYLTRPSGAKHDNVLCSSQRTSSAVPLACRRGGSDMLALTVCHLMSAEPATATRLTARTTTLSAMSVGPSNQPRTRLNLAGRS